jgi:hypothetical protein
MVRASQSLRDQASVNSWMNFALAHDVLDDPINRISQGDEEQSKQSQWESYEENCNQHEDHHDHVRRDQPVPSRPDQGSLRILH